MIARAGPASRAERLPVPEATRASATARPRISHDARSQQANSEDMPLPDLPLTLEALGSGSPDDQQQVCLATINVAPFSIGESDIPTSVLECTLGGVLLRRQASARRSHSLNRISDGFGIPARCTPIGLPKGERTFASGRRVWGGEPRPSLGSGCYYTVVPAFDHIGHELRRFWEGWAVGCKP